MNYETLYYRFVEHWKHQQIPEGVYTEKHHIIPRHRGGTDGKSNLVKLTYRQHIFAHRLLWKAYGAVSDHYAWLLMSGTCVDKREALGKAAGRRCVESGHLDKIRALANTPVRQEKLKLLQEELRNSDHYQRVGEICRQRRLGTKATEETRSKQSASHKRAYHKNPELYKLRAERGREVRAEMSECFANSVISNAERNEQYLYKVSNKSLNWFVSPEGLKFQSPIFAAKYYGNVKPHVIENWCKRNEHGWSRVPK